MSVLIFIEHSEGLIKKSAHEVLTYGAKLAAQLGTTAEGLVLGTVTENLSELGKYGITKINQINNESLNTIDSKLLINILLNSPK